MSDIIMLQHYILSNHKGIGLSMDERLQVLITEITQRNITNDLFSLSEIDDIALRILSILGYHSDDIATPIVKIVKQFDFKAYSEKIDDDNQSGDIFINGDTKEIYGHDKVIIVNDKDERNHQRFVAAHELAHYLFDFLGNPEYYDTKIKFTAAYYKDKHDTEDEKRANRFAASILMPEDLFIKQYNIARETDSRDLFVLMYLSRFFETSISSIEKRIKEVIYNKG